LREPFWLIGVEQGAPGCIASRFPRSLINADGPFFASNMAFMTG